jgi:ABC-type phosphate transport system auxiliary subunit
VAKTVLILGGKHFKQWLCETLTEILSTVERIETKQGENMTQVAQDFESLRQAIDAATTAVGNKIADLSGQITNSMTAAEVTQLKAEFQAQADKLNALAADPANPVPTP